MPSRQRHRRKAKRIAACRPQAAIRCCRQPKGGKAAEKEAAERQKKHTECAVPVGTNFLLGRAKSCQWQVFVRRRPPKQGELRTDVSKATMFQGDDSVLRPRFKALSKKIPAKFSGGTSRTRFFAQDGSEKALNRCEVQTLQREDLEWTSKE